ncbi:MAG: hypothetical protein AAF382_12580 [Pseudomonadota bacterium]
MNAHTATHLLSRHAHRPGPALSLLDDITLPQARAHEVCGNARQMLAMMIAGALTGPVFWITPAWQTETLNPEGMLAFANPARVTFVSVRRADDILWTLEEVLRSGAVPLVVADMPEPPAMTPVRRLHLAAETGASAGTIPPMALLLTPGEGGAPGIETRWHMAQDHGSGKPAWQLSRLRARTAPPKRWQLRGRPGAWQLSSPPKSVQDGALASG